MRPSKLEAGHLIAAKWNLHFAFVSIRIFCQQWQLWLAPEIPVGLYGRQQWVGTGSSHRAPTLRFSPLVYWNCLSGNGTVHPRSAGDLNDAAAGIGIRMFHRRQCGTLRAS